jgi:hypothetical protein
MTDKVKSDNLKLVADNDEKELVRQREKVAAECAASELGYATRALAANILRIIAGAGKGSELISQICEVLKAYQELQPLSGRACYPYPPSTPMVEGLRELDWRRGAEGYHQPTEEDLERWRRDGSADLADAKSVVAQAALRLTAAQLLRQPTQESTADHQLFSAIRQLEEARRVRNARWEEQWRRRSRPPEALAVGRAHVRPRAHAASSRMPDINVEQTRNLAPRELTKKIGIYDALDEQNRKRREAAKPEPK